MTADFAKDWFGGLGDSQGRQTAFAEAADPVGRVKANAAREMPKRFYTTVVVLETGAAPASFALQLDGRPARTKRGRPLAAGTLAAGDLLAAEWRAQGAHILPSTMPITRILHAAIDHVEEAREAVRDDILKYAGSDLVCYRAGGPDRLVASESRHWDPVLAHARQRYGARFVCVEGVTFVAQAPEAIAALQPALDGRAAAALAALHVMTTISGSALIALAVADGAIGPEAGFDAGEADADFEISVWGADDEALARRAARQVDFLAAATLLAALA